MRAVWVLLLSAFAITLTGASCARHARTVTFTYPLTPRLGDSVVYPRVIAGGHLTAAPPARTDWPRPRSGAPYTYYELRQASGAPNHQVELLAAPASCQITVGYYYLLGHDSRNSRVESEIGILSDTVAYYLAPLLSRRLSGPRIRDTIPVGHHLDGTKW